MCATDEENGEASNKGFWNLDWKEAGPRREVLEDLGMLENYPG